MRRLGLFAAVFTLTAHAAATEYFVAPDGKDDNPGTEAAPFLTFQKGLEPLQNGDTLTIREGTYRLMDGASGAQFNRPDGTAESHITIQAYPGEKPTFLGSLSTEGMTWESQSGGLYRLDASFLPNDPTGLFTGETRIEHVMKTVNGTRSHADVADLANPGEWTKADASGAGCPKDNTGCYIYMLPPSGMDPNAEVFELSQRKLDLRAGHAVSWSFAGCRSCTRRTRPSPWKRGEGQTIEDNILAHNSNGNDNSYSIFVSYGGGAIIRNNVAYDSKYWGGFSNSKGITLMDMDPDNPSLIENNEVYDIVGQGITSKDGVGNIVVRGNYVHDVGVCIQPASRRCHWKNPNCATTDPENYPGGGWTIQENAMVGCGVGVGFSSGEQNEDNRIFNNVFYECDSGVDVMLAHPGTLIANNIFAKTTRGVFLDHGGSGQQATFDDFLPVFSAHHNAFFGNTDDYLLGPIGPAPAARVPASPWPTSSKPTPSKTARCPATPCSSTQRTQTSICRTPLLPRTPATAVCTPRPTVDMGMYPLGGSSTGGTGGAVGSRRRRLRHRGQRRHGGRPAAAVARPRRLRAKTTAAAAAAAPHADPGARRCRSWHCWAPSPSAAGGMLRAVVDDVLTAASQRYEPEAQSNCALRPSSGRGPRRGQDLRPERRRTGPHPAGPERGLHLSPRRPGG